MLVPKKLKHLLVATAGLFILFGFLVIANNPEGAGIMLVGIGLSMACSLFYFRKEFE